MSLHAQHNKMLQVAIQAALESGAIQKRHYGKIKDVRFKGEINPVTEVDLKCEATIVKRIKKNFPGHSFLTEETGEKYATDSEYRWIIDPLDGTVNYLHGYPLFCTSIGLEYRGQLLLGAVYEPNMNQLFYALRGKGAFRNKKRISVSRVNRLKKALLSSGFAYGVNETDRNNFNNFEKFIRSSQAVRRDGVAAVDLCYVAWGRYEGFWELGLWPWDIAAGIVIVEEAGGRVSHFDGSPVDLHRKEIVVSNGLLHKDMIGVLQHG